MVNSTNYVLRSRIVEQSEPAFKYIFEDFVNECELNETDVAILKHITQETLLVINKKKKDLHEQCFHYFSKVKDKDRRVWMKERFVNKPTYHRYMEQIWIDCSQEKMAAMFGTCRETINRRLASLEKRGIIIRKKLCHDKEACAQAGRKRLWVVHTKAITLAPKYYKKLLEFHFMVKNARKKKRGRNQGTRERVRQLIQGLWNRKPTYPQPVTNEINLKFNRLNFNNINQGKESSPKPLSQIFSKKIENLIKFEATPSHLPSAAPTDSPTKWGGEYTVWEMYDALECVLVEKCPDMVLTKSISRLLGALKKQYFPTMEDWAWFLEAVKKCWYLMRDAFKMSLSWLLSFRTVRRILSGDFGIKQVDSLYYFVESGREKIARVDVARNVNQKLNEENEYDYF